MNVENDEAVIHTLEMDMRGVWNAINYVSYNFREK
jgi:hypothetical protein